MKPFSRSVIELFDGKRRYVIPLFQRQYAWRSNKQLPRLWDDIKNKAEQRLQNRSTMPHFLGAAVISQIKTFGNEVQTYDVIDGQQRLTTFQLFLIAFRDLAQAMGSEYADELNKHILNDGIMANKEIERFKLWPTQVDRPQMIALVDAKSFREVQAKERTELGKEVTGIEPNMVAAYRYFYEQIKDFIEAPMEGSSPEERVQALFQTLKNDLALVSIELEGDDDPQVIFETLNGYSEPLTPTDLMRNFVFQRAYREERQPEDKAPEALYNEYWLPFDRSFWKKEEKQGRLKRPRVDIFFQHLLAMKKASDVNVGRLYYEYRDWILLDQPYASVEQELRDAQVYGEIYKQLLNFEQPNELSEFAQVLNVFDVKTVTPLVLLLRGELGLEGNTLALALSMLESYLVRRAICGYTTKNYNRFFLQLVESLRGSDDPLNKLKNELLKGSGEAVVWPSDTEFGQAWLTQPLYKALKSQRLQFLLKKIEQALRTSRNEDIVIRTALSIEHVMPEAWEEHWPLPDGRYAQEKFTRLFASEPDELAKKRDSVVHTIGNLTLLTQPMNSSLQNAAYADKRPEILKHSALALNREFHGYTSWDEATIEQRGRKMLDIAFSIWPHHQF